MKAYKGFKKDMTCRDFQFKEGETYHEDNAELCECGFHACENPLDCFYYYAPSESVYHEVEIDEVSLKHGNDSKICGKTIKIGGRLSIAKIVELAVDFVKTKTEKKKSAQGNYSAASAQGYYSAASAQGYCSAASVQGDYSAASAQGSYSAASVQGDCSAASVQGDYSAASVQGDCSAASAQGYCSAASVQGNYSAASAQGKDSIAIGCGYQNKAKACIGSAICLCERGDWNGETCPLIAVKAAIVDGETLKADTWYELKNGEFVEVDDA